MRPLSVNGMFHQCILALRLMLVNSHHYPLRYLEIRLPVSGCERGLACHPERSEGSVRAASQILRCAQDDTSHLQIPAILLLGLMRNNISHRR